MVWDADGKGGAREVSGILARERTNPRAQNTRAAYVVGTPIPNMDMDMDLHRHAHARNTEGLSQARRARKGCGPVAQRMHGYPAAVHTRIA
jgi:hypothetical protein